MKKKRDEVMQDLRAAKPSDPEFLRDWADSPKAKQILDRVLASSPVEEGRSGRRSWSRPRLAWGAAALVVIVGLCLLATHLLTGPSANDSTSASLAASTLASTQSVSKGEALQQIVAMVQAVESSGYPIKTVTTSPDLAQSAYALGVLLASDGPVPLLDQPITRAQMALWLWRAFHPLLLPQTPTSPPSDVGSLTQEEQEAVLGLSQAGILDSGSAPFGGELPLSERDKALWLSRLAVGLQKETSTSR